ncbi:unnamed protein product [Zymoseptoria tritici ST99CH_1E4]|uniref:Uncharacterized protein n=1 Tax=Zymoseptoria tritici ST99CH_1E4 TaxID=1276532 RepID=A0A2H1GYL2_ZYMTR|nr:unnamed protein product [Zymoseptoria tritici ST99CH_1E4]
MSLRLQMLSKLSSSTNTVFSNYLSIAQFCVDLEIQRATDGCVLLWLIELIFVSFRTSCADSHLESLAMIRLDPACIVT